MVAFGTPIGTLIEVQRARTGPAAPRGDPLLPPLKFSIHAIESRPAQRALPSFSPSVLKALSALVYRPSLLDCDRLISRCIAEVSHV